MKKILVFLFVVCSFTAKAQDTTVIASFTMQVQHALYLMPQLKASADSNSLNTYIKMYNAISALGSSIPSATTVISISNMPVSLIANCYTAIGISPAGYGLLTPWQTNLNPYLSQSTNLNRQCAAAVVNFNAAKIIQYLNLYYSCIGHN